MRLWKSRPKCSPIHFMWKLPNAQLLTWKKIAQLFVLFLSFSQILPKKSPNMRKFAPSGHPGGHRRVTSQKIKWNRNKNKETSFSLRISEQWMIAVVGYVQRRSLKKGPNFLLPELMTAFRIAWDQGDQVWANFGLLGDFLWVVLLKITEAARMIGLLFPK
jgi:hypothetical protein